MEVFENFTFLNQEFPHAAESASFAERHVYGDPRASCFRARLALEYLIKRVYKVDKTLSPPKITNLDGYLSEPAFRDLVPEVVWQKPSTSGRRVTWQCTERRCQRRRRRWTSCGSSSTYFTGAGRTYLRQGAGESARENLRRITRAEDATENHARQH